MPMSYSAILAEHRRKLERLIDHRGVDVIRKLYEEANAVLVAKLRRLGSASDTFTSHIHRLMLAQVRQGQMLIVRRMAGELGDISAEAQRESLRGLISSIKKLDRQFIGVATVLPIEEAARFEGVIDKRRSSLLKQHTTSMARYGAAVVEKVEQQMALSLATAEPLTGTISRVESAIGGEWYRAERIVVTETAAAYNASHADGIKEAAKEIPSMRMRWEEHVDDSGEPMDDRVSVDSLAMHGQVASPGENFVMPPTAPDGEPVPPALVGQRWAYPPNRPRDRAVVGPWRREWGVPGWTWRGRRVQL